MANTRQQSLTINSTKVPSDQTGFVAKATRSELDNEIVDPLGSNKARSDGGDLRVYENNDQTGRLNLEIVQFEYDSSSGAGDADIEFYFSDPFWVVSSLTDTVVYLEYGDATLTQPSVSDPFGRNAVWQDYEAVLHCEDINWTDSTGNGDFTVDGSNPPTVVNTTLGNAYRFTEADNTFLTRALTSSITSDPITLQTVFINTQSPAYTMYAGGVSGTAGGRDFSIGGISGSSSLQIRDTFPVNQGRQFLVDTVAGAIGDEFFINSVFNSGNLTSSGWINGTFGTDTVARTLSTTLVNVGIGGRIDGSPDYYSLDIVEFRTLSAVRSADYFETENNNVSSPSTFWTKGTPIPIGPTGNIADVDVTLPEPVFSASAIVTLPNPTADVDVTLPEPVFSASSTVTLPNPTADVDVTLPEPVFSASSTVTLPNPTADVDVTLPEPVFSASSTVTLPNPTADVDVTLPEPLFSASSTVTLPNPTADVDVTLPEPVFSVSAFVTEPVNEADVDITLPIPIFSASSTVTLPQPTAGVDVTLPEPVFSVSASVSGIEINPTDEAIIVLRASSNLISLIKTSTTIKL